MSESKPVVEETTQYDNFIGKKVDVPDLTKFLDEDTIQEAPELIENDWKKHWKGMPEYEQEDNPPYKQIYLNFRNKEDYEAFAKLVDQNLTEKTKSIWYPKLDKDANSLKRWIVEDES